MSVDTQVSAALTSVDLSDPILRRTWFELLCEVHRELSANGEPSWDDLSREIEQRADTNGIPADVPQAFVQYLNDNCSSPESVIAEMVGEGDQLPALYEQAAGTPGQAGEEGYDQAAWGSFLATNGPRWNGDESAWAPFVEWFQYEAEQNGLGQPAKDFLGYAASQPDKQAVFTQYGVTVGGGTAQAQQTDVSTYPELTEGASGEWVDYLDTMLRSKGF